MINNDYYDIAMNDLQYLQAILNLNFYNQIAAQAQQVAEKALKSVFERVCTNNTGLLNGHNLRLIYTEIDSVIKKGGLNRSDLSLLKDFYFDSRYPGDNFITVSENECIECISIMYDVLNWVNNVRKDLGLPVKEYDKASLTRNINSF